MNDCHSPKHLSDDATTGPAGFDSQVTFEIENLAFGNMARIASSAGTRIRLLSMMNASCSLAIRVESADDFSSRTSAGYAPETMEPRLKSLRHDNGRSPAGELLYTSLVNLSMGRREIPRPGGTDV